jgi:molecular chaperone GrpE
MSPERKPGVDSEDASVAEAASRVASAPEATPEQSGDEPTPSEIVLEGEEQELEAVGPDPEPEPVDLEAVSAKAQKADEYLELAQRTKADFENFRKRSAREAAAAQERGVAKLARELLPAVDNLDRALAAIGAAATDAGGELAANGDGTLASGIKLVHADVIAALGRVGIQPFSPEGEPFDPVYHEAVAQQPIPGAEPGTVVEVYQRGYRIGESVLRPARVLVAG